MPDGHSPFLLRTRRAGTDINVTGDPNLGIILTDADRNDEAVVAYERAIDEFKAVSATMSKEELSEHLASIELSMCFSLGIRGDTVAADRVLQRSIARRRKLLDAGHDHSAVGLANSLLAMTRQRLACGAHLEALSAATGSFLSDLASDLYHRSGQFLGRLHARVMRLKGASPPPVVANLGEMEWNEVWPVPASCGLADEVIDGRPFR